MVRSVAALALFAACSTTQSAPIADEATPLPTSRPVASLPAIDAGAPEPAAPPSCIADGKPYDTAILRAGIARLASPELDGRVPGTANDLTARTIIADRFRCLGLTPAGAGGSYDQPFVAAGAKTANVVGFIAGADATVGSEIIVVGAHHDHLGAGHLGANDNASGVVALLAIAQAIRQAPAAPRRTIVFATWGGEELGLLGATHYAANPPAALPMARVVQYVNLDMVGSYSSKTAVYAFGAAPTLAAGKLLDKLHTRYPKLHVGIGGRSDRGDQVPFCEQGIPYVFFWTPDARCYHETCDTVEKIDLPHMSQIASLAGDLVAGLADSKVDLADLRARLRCGGR